MNQVRDLIIDYWIALTILIIGLRFFNIEIELWVLTIFYFVGVFSTIGYIVYRIYIDWRYNLS